MPAVMVGIKKTTEPNESLLDEDKCVYSLKVDGTDPKFGDFRDDLVRDGYAVVKGAVPRERALQYADKMYSLLESL